MPFLCDEEGRKRYEAARKDLERTLAESPSIARLLANREPPAKPARIDYFVWSDHISYYETGEDGQLLLHARLVKPKDPGELKALLASLDHHKGLQPKPANPSTAPEPQP